MAAQPNLYSTLGVDPSATEATIRRAYRKAAKRAHPDGGGSPEAFNKLSVALAVLTDEKARAHYDRTGEIDPPGPDTEEANILNYCAQALFQAMEQVSDLDRGDLLLAAKRIVQGMPGSIQANIRNIKTAVERIEKVERRLRKKQGTEGPDHLRNVLVGQINGARAKVRELEEEVQRAKKALLLFDSYYYDFIKPTEGLTIGGFRLFLDR